MIAWEVKMLMRIAFGLIALSVTLTATPAQSCVFLPVPEQSTAEKRRWSRVQTEERSAAAVKRMAAGIDTAKELAELLVPNIRPIYLVSSDCGPEGEIDFAGEADNAAVYSELAKDPRLARINLSSHRRTIIDSDAGILGYLCNPEFRDTFASWLRDRLPAAQLQRSWLFLVARKREAGNYASTYGRIMAFDRQTRTPPVHWMGYDEWIRKDIDKFVRKDIAGRALGTAMAAFWSRHGPHLGDDEGVCPVGVRKWRQDKEHLITTIVTIENSRRSNLR